MASQVRTIFMENCIVIDLLPCALQLTDDEWTELLEQHDPSDEAGVSSVTLLPDVSDVVCRAVLVQLMLENYTDSVMASLAEWLPAQLVKQKLDSGSVELLRFRAMHELPSDVLAKLAVPPRHATLKFPFQVPSGAASSFKTLDLKVELNATAGGSGARLWVGGIVLAEWVWHRHCMEASGSPVFGRRVLELGAGFSGIVARVSSAAGASHVSTTDGITDVMRQLARNVRNTRGVTASHLQWSVDKPSFGEQAADVVLFADCIYSPRGAELLLGCIRDCLAACPCVVVHGTLQKEARSGCSEFQEGMLKLGFQGEREPLSEELLAAVAKLLPRDDAEDKGSDIDVWTWRSNDVRLR